MTILIDFVGTAAPIASSSSATVLRGLSLPQEPGLHLWTGEQVASAALDAGLFNWLMARTQ